MSDEDLTRLADSHSPASTQVLSKGQEFGQYRVEGMVGRGGMGEVYAVTHTVLDTRHALKVIRPEILEHSEAPQRFRREAQVMAKLRHENIIQVDDFGTTDDLTWLRMELVEGGDFAFGSGQSLADIMEQSSDPIPEPHVKELLGQVLEGLRYAHEMGVVHRDLKPANLLLDSAGKIKVADFGLVRLAGVDWLQGQVQLTVARSMADPDATRMEMQADESKGTETRALLGTYEYMSPEQKKGEEADYRSDLYSVGLIAYRMLTGEATMGFELPSELVEGLDARWDVWIRKATATRLGRRFEDAVDMMYAMPGMKISAEPIENVLSESVAESKKQPEDVATSAAAEFHPNQLSGKERSKARMVFMQSDSSYAYLTMEDQERCFEEWLLSSWSASGRVVRVEKPKKSGPTKEDLEREVRRLEEARKQVGGSEWKEMHSSDAAYRYLTKEDQVRVFAEWLERKHSHSG